MKSAMGNWICRRDVVGSGENAVLVSTVRLLRPDGDMSREYETSVVPKKGNEWNYGSPLDLCCQATGAIEGRQQHMAFLKSYQASLSSV